VDGPFELVTFDCYLLDQGQGRFELRDDDGVTQVSAAREGAALRIDVSGAKAHVAFRVLPLAGVPSIESVTLNGASLPEGESGAGSVYWTVNSEGAVEVRPA
jgi:hypothetical protein